MRRVRDISWVIVGWLAAPLAFAADTEKLRNFGLAESKTETPGLGRVLIAFLLVAALAWASVWLLRRYGFRGSPVAGGTAAAGTQIRNVARSALPGGVVCHVVETQGRQVLITVTRHGVASVVLGEIPTPPATGSTPS